MLETELLVAYSMYSNKGVYAVLVGSGISRSAGILTGWEILLQLISRVAVLKTGSIPDNPEEWYLKNYSISPNYSDVIGQLSITSEERVNLLKPFFEATPDEIAEGLKQPTSAHRSIARLVQLGYIRVIITTNFDRLMENALREIGIEATVIYSPDQVENVMPLIHNPLTIIKINGDYLNTSFLNIESELMEYDPRTAELMKFVFENFGLLSSGWSAKWDTGLKNIIESSNKFRFSSFFTFQHSCETELQQLVNYRHGKSIEIKDADTFFHELAENVVALESNDKAIPFSKPIAIARLKKYIAKDDQRIALFDLVQQETDSAFKLIYSQVLPRPDNDTIRVSIDFMVNKLDLLCSLICQGVYWGTPGHHDIWLKSLSKFSHPTRTNSSYDVWINLAYFPALLLFYFIGITGLYQNDFLLLERLFSLQIFNPYGHAEKANILVYVNTSTVIDKDLLKTAYKNNNIVPMSELLYQIIKPEFEQYLYLADIKEFDELFDRFELLISLQNIKILGDGWFPVGRFKYRRRDRQNPVNTRFEELKKQQGNFDWIRNNLFESHKKLLEHYNYFNERMRAEHF